MKYVLWIVHCVTANITLLTLRRWFCFKLSLFGTSDIIGHVTVEFLYTSNLDRLPFTVDKIWCLKDFAVMTLAFWRQVTSQAGCCSNFCILALNLAILYRGLKSALNPSSGFSQFSAEHIRFAVTQCRDYFKYTVNVLVQHLNINCFYKLLKI